MPRLADETLVAAHETVLDRWKKTKSEQYWKLHESVRQDPIYRPLRPSTAEEEFYREREAYLDALPRFRLRAIYDPLWAEDCASEPVVIVEDRKRMGIYRDDASAIERGTVDWPSDVAEFAREAMRDPDAVEPSAEAGFAENPCFEEEFSKQLFDLFPGDVVRDAAAAWNVDEYDVYRALDELQVTLVPDLLDLVREHDVETIDTNSVVLVTEGQLIDEVLFGYGEAVRSAVTTAHASRCDVDESASGQPVLVGCSEKAIRRVRRTLGREPSLADVEE
ncbi:hypothetical protein [Natrarchaeobius chitinivorans]|uniref:Uncharacterized protein n=1 Tax=Natrarchaeobius chitinivorans TaxID=1679083 RepID=A0A3N6M3E7_NATCH|nr:hypothetical protein [Natrarchaeobius chitinivorans]RQG90400.1 hypothetical protein EA473_21260 [Natrarchaeobius chitinivorans]